MSDWDVVSTTASPKNESVGQDMGDWDAAAPMVEATPTEKGRAISQGGVGSALEMGGAVAGMAAGAQVGTLGGPLAPVTVPLGAAVGAAAGYVAGKGTKEQLATFDFPGYGAPLTYRRAEDLPANLRPYAYGGEAVGGGLPFGAAPLAAARAGMRLPASKVGNWINRIVDTAEKYPGTFASAEAFALGGSGVAGGAAETYAPGETGKRILAEMGGGLFNPSRIIAGTARGSFGVIKNTFQTMTPAGRETRAAKYLQTLVETAGEDPSTLADALRASKIPGMKLTPGQQTGSPALIALEAKLSQDSLKFGADSKKSAEDGMLVISHMIESLSRTGDPQALLAAAKMRDDYFRALLAQNLKMAESKALQAASKISGDTPKARSIISTEISGILEETLSSARKVETQLWDKIPKEGASAADNVIAAYSRIKGDLLPEESLPAIIEGFVERVGKEGTTAGELLRLRNRALTRAREAAGAGDWDEARILGEIAEGALDDLGEVVGDESLDAARAFSRELNETYTRTFAGQSLSKARKGGARIPPELMLRRAMSTGKEAAALRFRELEDAAAFLPDRNLGGPEAVANFTAVVDAQERFLRLTMSESIDPNTGRASAGKLSKLMRDNEELLDRFPEVRQSLQNTMEAETGAVKYTSMTKQATRVIEREAEFSRISKLGSAVDAVSGALKSKDPVARLGSMAKLAKRSGPEAVKGLQAAVYDHAIRLSRDSSDNFSFREFQRSLFDPIKPDTPSLVDTLVKDGVMGEGDVGKLKNLLDEAMKIEAAIDVSTDVKSLVAHLDQAVPSPDALLDLIIRIHGAKFGAALAGKTTGSSLVAAQRGSLFFRQLFGKVPQGKVQAVLIEAASDPEFMALLLEKSTTPDKAFGIGLQIHAYLFQAGLIPFTEEE